MLVAPFIQDEVRADSGGAAPRRFVSLYFSCGRVESRWTPTGAGSDFTLSPTLKPFESLKDDMIVVEGVNNPQDAMFNEPHALAMVRLTTGVVVTPRDGATVSNGPSIDQILAKQPSFAAGTRVPSLVLSADKNINLNMVGQYCISHAGPNQPIVPENRPLEIYKHLFNGVGSTMVGAGQPNPELERLRADRRSALDFFKSDWQRMMEVTPSAQRPKLQAHFDGIRQLEKNLDATAPMAGVGCVEPGDLPAQLSSVVPAAPETNPDDYPALMRLNMEMIRLGMACDVTRVASFAFDTSVSALDYGAFVAGIDRKGRHAVAHEPNAEPTLAAQELWLMQQVAAWLTAFKMTPEGTGSMLDNMVVAVTSEHGHGGGHTGENIPVLLFGKAGGKLRTGQFLRVEDRNVNDLWLTVTKALGLPGETFGQESMNAGPLPGLLS